MDWSVLSYCVTSLNILSTVESLSECSSLSSLSRACAVHATACAAATPLALEAIQTLSPSVTSFPLVCLHVAQQFFTQCSDLWLKQCNYTRCVPSGKGSQLSTAWRLETSEEARLHADERGTTVERCNEISDLLRAVWDVPPCCLVGINRRFGEHYCHRLHGRKEYAENGSNTVLWNVVETLPLHTASGWTT